MLLLPTLKFRDGHLSHHDFLKKRGGSSLVAIKKHIGSQHKVDWIVSLPSSKVPENAVVSGTLVQKTQREKEQTDPSN
ncbi:hypothetical protein TNIN_501121 [Trichonephila inaurata madagascariensis]|uniref:Uncharacterized protein n=1 Tax=Trichonephila inaurata madagascariensis TaxID=2747483 RepID=A0A8X6YFZ5_9ARAC|nr:hypothetical protein TNIN_501121 [Trichonephila inaurata madagascariensis]